MATRRGTVGDLLVNLRLELGQLRTDVKEVERTFNSSFNGLRQQAATLGQGLFKGLIGGLSIGVVTGFARSIVDLGGKIKDLSEQTGISVTLLSGLKSVLEENGTTMDAFALGVFRAQKELAEVKKSSDPAAKAVRDMGLNFEELINAEPDKFIEMVSKGLGTMEDRGQRAAAASALMSRGARELIPALLAMADGFDDLRTKGLSQQQIDSMDELGDSFTRLANKIRFEAMDALVGFGQALERSWRLVQINIARFKSAFREGGLLGLGGALAGGASPLDPALGGGVEGIVGGAALPAPKSGNRNRRTLAGEEDQGKKAVDDFTASLKKQADQLFINIVELQRGGDAAKLMAADLEFAAFRQKLLADPKTAHAVGAATKAYNAHRKELEILTEELRAAKWEAGALEAAIKAASQDSSEWHEHAKLIEELEQKARDAAKAFEDMRRASVGAMFDLDSQEFFSQDAGVLSETDRIAKKFQDRRDEIKESFHGITESITNGIRETVIGIQRGDQTLSQGMENLFRNILLDLQVTILEKGILDPIKGIVNSFFSGFVDAFFEGSEKAGEKIANQLGKDFGAWLKEGLSNAMGSSGGGGGEGGGIGGFISTFFTNIFKFLGMGGAARGGMIRPGLAFAGLPQFAAGGAVPIIAHGGEFVLNKRAVDSLGQQNVAIANATGKFPGRGGPTQFTAVFDFTGAVAPSDLKTGRREVRQFMIDEMDTNPRLRAKVREASRR